MPRFYGSDGGPGCDRSLRLQRHRNRTFDERGRVTRQNLGSALSEIYGYGSDGRLRQFTTVAGLGARSLLVAADNVGRVSAELRDVLGVPSFRSGTITNANVLPFESPSVQTRSYTYDSSDNWTAVTGRGFSYSPKPNAANAYQQTPDGTAQYDEDGRQIASGAQRFDYDVWGRLVRVSSPGLECRHEYDSLGRRASETGNGKTTTFDYDGEDLVRESPQGGEHVLTLHAGLNRPVARLQGPNVTYLLGGAAHSVRAAFDASGHILERYTCGRNITDGTGRAERRSSS